MDSLLIWEQKPGPPKVHHDSVCMYVLYVYECVKSQLCPTKQCVCDTVCQYLISSSCLMFIAKTKVNVIADNELRCVICVLRHRFRTHTVTRIHTHIQASSLHMHISHHLAKMPANKPLFTDMKQQKCLFFRHWKHPFLFIRTRLPESYIGRDVWCFTEGLGKTNTVFLSVQK